MKKHYLLKRTSFLYVLISSILILSGCQKDDFDEKKGQLRKGISFEYISLNDFHNKSKVEKCLKNFRLETAQGKELNRSNGDEIYDSINNFTIHLDDVFYVRDGERNHWLTFYVSREEPTTYMENLILSWDDSVQNYIPYLAKYEFSEEDYDAMENGEFINEFEFKTEVINLNKSSQPCYRMIKIGPVYDEHGQIVAIEGYYLIEIPCNEDGNQNEENGAGDNEEGGNGNGDENNGPGLGWHWPDGHNFGNSNDPDFNFSSGGEQNGGGENGNEPPHNDSGHTNPPIVVTTPVQEPPEPPEPPEEDEEDCNTSKDDLKEVFSNTDDATLQEIADYINEYGADFGIDTKEELQHFLAQVGHESTNWAGVEFGAFEENLNYRIKKLGIDYWRGYFNPWTDPTSDPEKENPFDYEQYPGSTYVDHEDFANHVYDDANRDLSVQLGNDQPGDGYKFRGRGLIQLTGKYNYTQFNNFYQTNYDSSIDLLTNPSLLATDMKIAVIAALWYFESVVMANEDIDASTSVATVTELINTALKGLAHRKELFEDCQNKIDCIPANP